MCWIRDCKQENEQMIKQYSTENGKKSQMILDLNMKMEQLESENKEMFKKIAANDQKLADLNYEKIAQENADFKKSEEEKKYSYDFLLLSLLLLLFIISLLLL